MSWLQNIRVEIPLNFFNVVALHFSPVDQDKVEIVSGQPSNFIPDVCKERNPWFSRDRLPENE